jgi:hypothetical protein
MSSSWIDQVRSSHNLQLAATAVASGLLVGSAILGLQKAKQEYRVSDLKSSIPDLDKDENVVQVCFVHLCGFFLSRRKRVLIWFIFVIR